MIDYIKQIQQEDITLLHYKNEEYARDDDPFEHLKAGAKHEGRHLEEHIYSMWTKHIVSVKLILDRLQDPDITREQWYKYANLLIREKLKDDRCYNYLMTCAIIDKLNTLHEYTSDTFDVTYLKPVEEVVKDDTPGE